MVKKVVILGEQKAADNSKHRAHLKHQETAVRSNKTPTKTMKSAPRSTGLHTVVKKSVQSAEGQVITKTTTTNAFIEEKPPCNLLIECPGKEGEDKVNPEQVIPTDTSFHFC